MALSQGTIATGNASVNLEARGAADKPSLNGTITAKNIQMSGKDIAQPIQIPSVTLNLTPSQVQSNAFNMISGGTTLNAQLTVRDYVSPSPVVDATVRAPNAQLPAILSLAKAYGVTALDKVNGAGTMSLDMHAAGPVKSLSKTDIIRALNGTINLNLNNVKYSGANLSQQLASIAGFLNGNSTDQTAQGITNISKMTGDIIVRNGIAQTNNLQAQLQSRIKALTGGDTISARFIRQDFFEYTPQFKLVIAGNHKPGLRSVDEAIRRRMHLIPFEVQIPEPERDKQLTEKLKAEWPAILRWAVEGCLAWQREGLNPPKVATEATENYLSDEATVANWIAERCELGGGPFVASVTLYTDWREWCETRNEFAGSIKNFSQTLDSIPGVTRDRTATVRGFKGIRLRSGYNPPDLNTLRRQS